MLNRHTIVTYSVKEFQMAAFIFAGVTDQVSSNTIRATNCNKLRSNRP